MLIQVFHLARTGIGHQVPLVRVGEARLRSVLGSGSGSNSHLQLESLRCWWDWWSRQSILHLPDRIAQGACSLASILLPPTIDLLPLLHHPSHSQTRVMSSSGSSSLRGNALILQTAADMWARGRFRFFFRGLPAGLIGVFPYSAIDMSTFEGIKLAYTQWKGEEPGIAGSLCFGAFSGGVGATSALPLFSRFLLRLSDLFSLLRCLPSVRLSFPPLFLHFP
jgi:hypothetical protein